MYKLENYVFDKLISNQNFMCMYESAIKYTWNNLNPVFNFLRFSWSLLDGMAFISWSISGNLRLLLSDVLSSLSISIKLTWLVIVYKPMGTSIMNLVRGRIQ